MKLSSCRAAEDEVVASRPVPLTPHPITPPSLYELWRTGLHFSLPQRTRRPRSHLQTKDQSSAVRDQQLRIRNRAKRVASVLSVVENCRHGAASKESGHLARFAGNKATTRARRPRPCDSPPNFHLPKNVPSSPSPSLCELWRTGHRAPASSLLPSSLIPHPSSLINLQF
jgi:hypothetical protein